MKNAKVRKDGDGKWGQTGMTLFRNSEFLKNSSPRTVTPTILCDQTHVWEQRIRLQLYDIIVQMPRHPDPAVELRILDAAHKLWVRGGTEALTMRTVARAARTNTPAIYRRFKDRQDILRALLLRIQQDVIQAMVQASSPEELCELYLHYALTHPREYELYFLHQHEILYALRRGNGSSAQNTYPGREFVRKQLAKWLGGTAEERTRLHLALWATMHGTVLLLNSKTVQGRAAEDLLAACRTSLRLILENASVLDAQGMRRTDGL